MYRSKPCLAFFSAVVKNVASPNIEIKKLVYIYLLQHAELEPDLALLSINTIQKSLTDQKPQVRSLALRTMSGIRVPVISQIVSLAIKRGVTDMSPHVRKAAALAIPKCYRLDPATMPQLVECLSTLLGDKQYFVVGPAAMAFSEICPDRFDLIHRHYRALAKMLVDMDEWGQLHTLRLMTSYARHSFPLRTQSPKRLNESTRGFYDDEICQQAEEISGEKMQVLDPDLELFLKSCRPLLSSRNPAVVVATVRCFRYLGTVDHLDAAVGPLVALLRCPSDIQEIVMFNVVAVCLHRPESFVRYVRHFLVKMTDPVNVACLKFEVMTLIFPHCESEIKELIICELDHFIHTADGPLVSESVRALGRCARTDPKLVPRCLKMLLQQLSSEDDHLIAECVTVIRHLIQQNPEAHVKTVIRLAKNLDNTTNPQARASIIWLVGEYASLPEEDNIAPDVLRILVKGFVGESEAAKLQIILLAAKVYLHYLIRNEAFRAQNSDLNQEAWLEPASPQRSLSGSLLSEDTTKFEGQASSARTLDVAEHQSPPPPEHPIPLLWTYLGNLTRYDTSYDLRDRMRLYQALLAKPSSTQLASLLLLAPKPVPLIPSPSQDRKSFLVGSSSLVIGLDGTGQGGVIGYEQLPDWVKEGDQPDPRTRNIASSTEGLEVRGGASTAATRKLDAAVASKQLGKTDPPGKERTLDEWLAEDEEAQEDDVEEEDDDEESSEEETETDTGDEDEDEEREGEGSDGEDSGA